ncbi:MAG: DNA-3-methyladenine glycosylase 2 family protein [Sorangiineae bacterium]|nr:DNA-3-methyladenine glycosylase 2 family protein [Polyangiaceae bacterium]MEB2324298.1 DNA-3-methyladenine glycosylase 2 family protein [Sorangiineae bacterium]
MTFPPSAPRGALPALRRADPRLAALIARVGRYRLEVGRSGSHFGALVRSIVYQQLSGKAAATIHGRLRAALEPEWPPSARALLALGPERLRACGLSRQKLASLTDLSLRVESGALVLEALGRMSDDEIVAALTQVRGIGVWSAEMFLMFQLGRPDVWPASDLGVRKAVARLYHLSELPDRRQMRERGERFRPFRTVAAWYLWRLLDLGEDSGGW